MKPLRRKLSMDRPVSGEEKQLADYQTRYAAYIVIERDQQIAVIETPNSAFFPLGGKIEGKGTREEAVVHGLTEGMGTVAKVSSYLEEADEYFYSNYRATYYYNPGYFSAADSWKRIEEPTEKANKVWWVSSRETPVELKHGSHRWAVERWIEKNKN